jgi:sugar diacid utilization regulator
MASTDAILASPALAAISRVTRGGGDRPVSGVRVAEQFSELAEAPAGGFVILGREASASATDYRLDMGLRWASIQGVAAVCAFSDDVWRPPVTAVDIAERAGIALLSVPAETELTWLVRTVLREVGGSAELALARAEAGLAAVLAAEEAGADPAAMLAAVSQALGTDVEPRAPVGGEVGAQVGGGSGAVASFTAPGVHGDLAVAARLVLHAAAAASVRLLDAVRRARELPIRSRGELLAELLMSGPALTEDLLDRARQLGVPVAGWHVAVRLEADNLESAGRDEVHRFELLESAGQVALQAAAAAGGTWYASRIARGIVLVCMTSSDPGAQGSRRASRSADRARLAISARLPGLRVRAGVGTAHEGPMGLRATVAEARVALVAARAAGKPEGVAAHDAAGVQRMLMEWYASDTARASVHAQLAPLEQLGPARGETAIRTLAAYLDEQGSIVRTAQRLHLHRNAVTYRLRRITELLGADLNDPDQRLALQLACRARLLE